MLTISLHGMLLDAPVGLYPEELVLGNAFEVDVDVFTLPQKTDTLPFVDYTLINKVVRRVFQTAPALLEDCVRLIHQQLAEEFPAANRIRIVVRKMNPPMSGTVRYAQVTYER